MKRIYLSIAAVMASFAVCTESSAQQNNTIPSDNLIWTAPRTHTAAADAEETIILVDEDFSGLTAGSEDKPDSTPLEDNLGWVNDGLKPYHDSCTKPWGGMGLTAAGGAIAVTDGFLNTPTGDYSGKLRMTCRIRLPKGQQVTDWNDDVLEQVPLDIILLRRSVFQDFKRVTVFLTEEWQDFTFEADNGWFSDTMIQFFTQYNMTFLVDDVRIEHVITSIEYPHANPPTTVSDDTFIAHWDPTGTAEEYLLSVYTKEDNTASDKEEGDFECINTSDGKMIDETNPGYPAGWNIDVTSNGNERHLFTEQGMYNSGKQSLCLDAAGDFIENRAAADPIKEAHFWVNVDDSQMPSDSESLSKLTIQVSNGTGWFDLFYVSVEAARQLGEGTMVDCTPYLGMVDRVMQMRIIFDRDAGDGCLVAIDDFGFNAPGMPIKKYFFEDRSVPTSDGCSYQVTVPDPNAEYFYYLKARNSKFTSDASNEIEVFDVHEPVALPATDVTADSYTANWKCGPKSDFFAVNQFLRYTAEEDIPEYVVLEEDFSKVVSDAKPDAPETGELAEEFVSLDQYTKIPGWRAGSYGLADGMLGGIEAEYPYKIGSVLMPKINLSHNNGICSVTIRAYGQKGDWLIIGGNSQITVGAMEFAETGISETTFTLEGCSDEEEFEIYTQNYGTFMLDYIKITQPLEKGDEVTILTGSQVSESADVRSMSFEGAPFTEGLDLCYNIIAYRLYHGSYDEIWRSHDSNMIVVGEEDTGISNVTEQLPSCIRVRDGGIAVTAADDTVIRIYDFAGQLLKSEVLGQGENFVKLGGGAYIIAVGGMGRAKVVIR